jgi:hypothetical protein
VTIEKGELWGVPSIEPEPEVTVGSDAELADAAYRVSRGGGHLRAVVSGGDLLASLGLAAPRPPDERIDYPLDLGVARLRSSPDDGHQADREVPFVAHLIIGGPGPLLRPLLSLLGHQLVHTTAIMNSALWGPFRLGPRAHPNDGLLDVVDGRLPFGDRREATKRARSGSHLPHPALTVTRTSSWSLDGTTETTVSADDRPVGSAVRIDVALIADALTVTV